MHSFIVVTGGTRSGKSRFAVDLAKRVSGRVVYLATCEAADKEMRQRIVRHQRQRPKSWRTIEHPTDPARALTQLPAATGGVLIDCLTMYVSGLLVRGDSDVQITQKIRRLCTAIRRAPFPVILVTNEVGFGIVPEYPLGRRFRDLAGLANQLAAASADHVVLMVAGIPLWIKSHHQNDAVQSSKFEVQSSRHGCSLEPSTLNLERAPKSLFVRRS
ncbi:MAG: bifunctional adenosylcobinamide kinase/adenosylcobinamide-phosphate guanylyltransferase [Candidatus Omnitrophica bacterium]|nr:bifunctional adenosylcobinamide kinase/adenosylcobinamide-phosphate guanylyltransferase [Candidatus Omnitrophota bacterium]